MSPGRRGVQASDMGFIHDAVTGAHMLHWLTLAVPAATLVVVSGVLSPRVASRLMLIGVVMSVATGVLVSIDPALSQARYGAPLPLAHLPVDLATGQARASLYVLRACLVADVLFWCCNALLLGAVIEGLTRRFRRNPRARGVSRNPLARRRLAGGSTARPPRGSCA